MVGIPGRALSLDFTPVLMDQTWWFTAAISAISALGRKQQEEQELKAIVDHRESVMASTS